MNRYVSEINRSMKYLAKSKKTIFLGQSVAYPGSSIYVSLKNIKDNQNICHPHKNLKSAET